MPKVQHFIINSKSQTMDNPIKWLLVGLMALFLFTSCNPDEQLVLDGDDQNVTFLSGDYVLNRPFNETVKTLSFEDGLFVEIGSDVNRDGEIDVTLPYKYKLKENDSTYNKEIHIKWGDEYSKWGTLFFNNQWLYITVKRNGKELDIVFKRVR